MNTPSRRPLVEADELGTFVTTVTIADGTDNQHKSIIRLVRDNIADLEEFGRVGFQNAPFVTNGGRQTREIAQLNEQQATLLLTYMRNNDQVRTFKKNLVRAFYDMAQQFNNQRSPMSEDDIVARALQITSNRVKALEAKVADDAPKVAQIDMYREAEGLQTIAEVANQLKIWAASNAPVAKVLHQDVYNLAGELHLIIRGDTVRKNQPTSRAVEAGWVRVKETVVSTNHGEKVVISTRLTHRGAGRLWDAAVARMKAGQPIHEKKAS